MSVYSSQGALHQLQWRYATKKFDSTRQIPHDVWHTLEQSLVLTPSSYGLQPWKFFVVRSQEMKDKLPPLSWGQKQPAECSHMVVMAIKHNMDEAHVDRYVTRTAELRNAAPERLVKFKQMMMSNLVHNNGNDGFDINEWATRQVYIALGQFMATCAMLGIDTCPMEGINNNAYDEVLGIAAQGYRTVVACAAGYRADDPAAAMAKVRFRTEEVVEVL
jgi:nitroreductase